MSRKNIFASQEIIACLFVCPFACVTRIFEASVSLMQGCIHSCQGKDNDGCLKWSNLVTMFVNVMINTIQIHSIFATIVIISKEPYS